jgi:hypothetical protein
MIASELFRLFELHFPQYAGEKVETRTPSGKNSVKIKQTNGQLFMFTYHNKYDWRFETIKSFMTKGN